MSNNTKYEWEPRKREYHVEQDHMYGASGFVSTDVHPFSMPSVQAKSPQQKTIGTKSARKFGDDDFTEVDPLGSDFDPLSDPLSTPTTPVKTVFTGQLNRFVGEQRRKDYLNWSLKKAIYLKKYTTDKSIPIISKIMSADEEDPTRAIKLEDRLKMRLDQLDKESKEQDVSYMTQQEYIKYLEHLNEDLMKAWGEDRARSLMIVIRCSKILTRNSVPQFYPSMFVLVCQVLDTYGKLVFERIREKSQEKDPMTGRILSKLPKDFTPNDVSEEAKEVCRNWFFKVASIRELIGRVYIEMAIIESYKFLNDSKKYMISHFERIAKSIRGIGDPLVATYARCYLARKGYELIPEEKGYLMIMFEDFLLSQKQWLDPSFDVTLKASQLNRDQYLDLFSPAVEWILENIGNNASEALFQKVISLYETHSKQSMVLNHIIASFEANIISNSASLLAFLIKECNDGSLPRYKLFRTLGEKFCVCPPVENHKLELLNEVWKFVTKIESITEYAPIVEVFIEFVAKNFELREVNILLGDLYRHLKQSGTPEIVEQHLQQILLAVLENTADFVRVFNMEYFLPIFDMLKSSTQIEVSKGMLIAFARREGSLVADPVIMNSLFDLAKTVHDSVNPLSEEIERERVAQCLCRFIGKIDFGTAFEKQLNFFVECRRSFSSFDEVQEAIVMQVLSMIVKTFNFVKGKHTKKTAAFVKACFAFCHITIPSIEHIFKRLHLFILTGQVAVMNNMLPQADSLFKVAIETLIEIPTMIVNSDNTMYDTEQDLITAIKTMSSCLISVPGHPEHGAFYLIRGLLNAINEYKWQAGSDAKIRLYISMLNALTTFYQENLPYGYVGVESNDTLFMENAAYRMDLLKLGNMLLEQSMKELTDLAQDSDASSVRRQAKGALELFSHIGNSTTLNPKLSTLATTLYNMASKVDDRSVKTWLQNERRSIEKKSTKSREHMQLFGSLK